MFKSLIKNIINKYYNIFKINTSDALVFDETNQDPDNYYPDCIETKFLEDYHFKDNQFCCNSKVSSNNIIKFYNVYEIGKYKHLLFDQYYTKQKVLSTKDFEQGNDGVELVILGYGGDKLVDFKVSYYQDCPVIEFERDNEISKGIYASLPEECVLKELYTPTNYPFIYKLAAQYIIINSSIVMEYYNGIPIFFSGITGNFYIQDLSGNLYQYFRFK